MFEWLRELPVIAVIAIFAVVIIGLASWFGIASSKSL